MTEKPSFHELATKYRQYTQPLTTELDSDQILTCFLLRDKIAEHLTSHDITDKESLTLIVEGDKKLKSDADLISRMKDVAAWRTSLNPPDTAWWWRFSPPEEKPEYDFFTHYDWLWNTLNIVALTVALALLVDISPRFLSDGADTTGAFVVVIQSMLTMITAGGILTKTGADIIERLFQRAMIPRIYWQEVKLGLAILLLILLLVFRMYGLSMIANAYHAEGQAYHYCNDTQSHRSCEPNLMYAQQYYERALKLDPTKIYIHHDLGKLYDDLQITTKAKTEYQIAVQGHYLPSYNNLARLNILGKKYDVAVNLLLNGLNLATNSDEDSGNVEQSPSQEAMELRYNMRKNLGWARFLQERYSESEAELKLAIELNNEEASAHCLLAQVLEAQEDVIEAYNEWETCSQFAYALELEEDTWIHQARLAQIHLSSLITVTTSLTKTKEITSDLSLEDDTFHLLISTENTVQLKRKAWSDYFTTSVGVQLQHGDQLQPTENAHAIVLCDDLTIWAVPDGLPSGVANGCLREKEPVLRYPKMPISKTFVMTDTPVFNWNVISDSLKYTITVKEGENIKWEKTISEPPITYTAEYPLEPEQSYIISIKANDGTVFYWLISTKTSETRTDDLNKTVHAIQNLDISSQSKLFALTYFYLEHGLIIESIHALQSYSNADTESAIVHRLLGDLYVQVHAPILAEASYQQALELATMTGNIEEQEKAQDSLGEN
ncbi:MAG: hypothetical protein B6242_15105 [Anaerolineaceae bacterium 4572_78]|nr:MAG: hypothetical protein B6242_15105 [Anaerolineaceae bacterium 4572_78]